MPDRGPLILEILTAAGAGGLLAKVVDALMKGRTPKKDVMTAVAEAAELLMDGMRQDLDALRKRVAEVEASHAECERRCDVLQGELREFRQLRLSDDTLRQKLRDKADAPGGDLAGAVIEFQHGEAIVTPADTLKGKP